jgi:hypothetical protein
MISPLSRAAILGIWVRDAERVCDAAIMPYGVARPTRSMNLKENEKSGAAANRRTALGRLLSLRRLWPRAAKIVPKLSKIGGMRSYITLLSGLAISLASTAQPLQDYSFVSEEEVRHFEAGADVKTFYPHGITFLRSKFALVQGATAPGGAVGCAYGSTNAMTDEVDASRSYVEIDIAQDLTMCRKIVQVGLVAKQDMPTWK